MDPCSGTSAKCHVCKALKFQWFLSWHEWPDFRKAHQFFLMPNSRCSCIWKCCLLDCTTIFFFGRWVIPWLSEQWAPRRAHCARFCPQMQAQLNRSCYQDWGKNTVRYQQVFFVVLYMMQTCFKQCIPYIPPVEHLMWFLIYTNLQNMCNIKGKGGNSLNTLSLWIHSIFIVIALIKMNSFGIHIDVTCTSIGVSL